MAVIKENNVNNDEKDGCLNSRGIMDEMLFYKRNNVKTGKWF